MRKYLVTGGTGLIGSNVCLQLIESGDAVRALVRPGSDFGPLAAIGAETFEGDVSSRTDVFNAADGCDAIINSAALLGGNAQDMDALTATNVGGDTHVCDAGAKFGIRVVLLSTTTFFQHDTPLTETSPVAADWSDDPYTQTKGAAYTDAMRRARDDGADVVVVIPGGTFGPGLSVKRAMSSTSFNRVLRGAINAKVTEYVTYPVPWVFAGDVAAATVAAARVGEPGTKYLAFGHEDAQSTAAFMNAACEAAGVAHRIAELRIDPSDPAAVALYGSTLVELAQRTFPVPWFDNAHTRTTLGYSPRPLDEAVAITVDWLRREGQIAV